MHTTFLQSVFWAGLFLVFYAYLGYGILICVFLTFKRLIWHLPKNDIETNYQPKVTFIICAFNEADWIASKIENTLDLDYPKSQVYFVVITDGSSDDTPDISRRVFEQAGADTQWIVLHKPERKGKIAAFHRAMTEQPQRETPENGFDHIIVSTDANTLVNKQALNQLIRHFSNPMIGAVAGEKRINMGDKDAANSAGEGIYWRYESLLKKWDAELWSVVGAAGELFAFREAAYEAVPPDTLVEDFYLTMRIAQKGYRVAYEPAAYAVENSSASISEELKRKIRIAAGGWQAVVRLAPLLNIFRYGTLSFQYISHRVLRWTLAPVFLPILLIINVLLAMEGAALYQIILGCQVLFYALALIGFLLERRQIKVKALFIPYYFCLMNYAMFAGLNRYLRGSQSVIWEKSKRAQ